MAKLTPCGAEGYSRHSLPAAPLAGFPRLARGSVFSRLRYRRNGEFLKRSLGTEGLKPVADSENGLDVLIAVAAQFLAKPPYMHVQRAGTYLGTIPPDFP